MWSCLPWTYVRLLLIPNTSQYLSQCTGANGEEDLDGDVYAMVKKANMFLPTERTGGISTTDLINRIVVNYDVFIRRNLKRGMNRQDMNVSFFREKRIKVGDHVEAIEHNVKSTVNNIKEKSKTKIEDIKTNVKDKLGEFDDNINKFVDNSQQWVRFQRRGRCSCCACVAVWFYVRACGYV